MGNNFLDDVVVRQHNSRYWKTENILRYKGNRETFTVPKGTITDFASIPRIFWNLIPPTGTYAAAAVLHDYLYATGIVSRKDADGIFRRAMKSSGTKTYLRLLMWFGCRAGGWCAWRKHRKKRAHTVDILD